MTTTLKLTGFLLWDLLKNRMVAGYAILLFLLSFSLFSLSADTAKSLISLLNVILIFVPLVALVFSTIHFFNSVEFIEMLLSQPLGRARVLFAFYLAIALGLLLAFTIGVGVPLIIYGAGSNAFILWLFGLLLNLVFSALGLLSFVTTRDKAKGIGITILLWIYFSLLYDGVLLLCLYAFADYPVENYITLIVLLNPVDLARIGFLIQLDIAALMGYSGAVFKNFFQGTAGILLSAFSLLLWVIVPLLFSARIFNRKDL
ncbi:ABC transporter permease subunit [Oscillatoria amoena NRMC-F 0135]|nr:ABC transporter permease subunit [Oscillatoria amoena NRMC-F 0135]